MEPHHRTPCDWPAASAKKITIIQALSPPPDPIEKTYWRRVGREKAYTGSTSLGKREKAGALEHLQPDGWDRNIKFVLFFNALIAVANMPHAGKSDELPPIRIASRVIEIVNMDKDIRFKFSAQKSYAAIRLMLSHVQNTDLHTILKSCYFGDKEHLNTFNRPIFGATYRAMKFGPVPLEIYEMAKGDAIWLGELGVDSYPWRLNGFYLERTSDSIVDTTCMSDSDLECITMGFEKSRGMTFTARTAATHGKDWQAANLGLMRYEDMLADSPDKWGKINYLREAAPHIRL